MTIKKSQLNRRNRKKKSTILATENRPRCLGSRLKRLPALQTGRVPEITYTDGIYTVVYTAR